MAEVKRDRGDAYIETIDRLEPDIAHIDASAYYASAAISLRRQADAAEAQAKSLETIAQILDQILAVLIHR